MSTRHVLAFGLLMALAPLCGCGTDRPDPRIAALVSELENGKPEARQRATRQLRTLGQKTFAQLQPLLSHDDARVRARAAHVWKHYADASEAHLTTARRLMGDTSWTVRRSAARVLSRGAAESAQAVEVLIDAATGVTGESHTTVLEEVALGLGHARGAQRETVIPLLMGYLGEGAPSLRARAVQALGRAGEGRGPVREAVIQALDADPDVLVRMRAAEAFWRLGGDPEEVLGMLVEGLGSPRAGVPEASIQGLSAMGREAAPAVDSLVRLLGDSTLRVRAAETLGALGPVAESAVPRLLEAADDPNSWYREAAAKAVRRIRGS